MSIFVLISIFIPSRIRAGTGLNGIHGLINTPGAYISDDASWELGVSFIPYEYSVNQDFYDSYYYASIGFLPFLEINLKVVDNEDTTTLGGWRDRVISFKLQFLKERQYLPALAAGIHDIYGTRLFHALYLVGSKSFTINPLLQFNLHLGYAGDRLEAEIYKLNGVFGGAELNITDYTALMGEYDSDKFNVGLSLSIPHLFEEKPVMGRIFSALSHMSFKFDLLGMKFPSGGLSFTFYPGG